MTSQNSSRAIIRVTTTGKNFSRINYSRRMYAVIRRYTPDVAEGMTNECFADLTGLRTFFKMTYKELAERIRLELQDEIGTTFTVRVATVREYEYAKDTGRKSKHVTTYKEINNIFAGKSFVATVATKSRRSVFATRKRLAVPFIGKVA